MESFAITQLLNKFISGDDNKINKHYLRKYVNDELNQFIAWTDFLLNNPEYKNKWRLLHDYIQSHSERSEYQKWQFGISEMFSLTEQITGWLNDHVDSEERMEFSIASKAAEISSGNEMFDYFQAMLVRHDQLLACVEIFKEATKNLAELSKLSDIGEIVTHSSFEYFCEKSLSNHIYELAKIMYKMRQQQTEH